MMKRINLNSKQKLEKKFVFAAMSATYNIACIHIIVLYVPKIVQFQKISKVYNMQYSGTTFIPVGEIPFVDCLVTHDKNNKLRTTVSLQKTNAYRQTTGPAIIQPNFSQSNDYTDLDKASATGFVLIWQSCRWE